MWPPEDRDEENRPPQYALPDCPAAEGAAVRQRRASQGTSLTIRPGGNDLLVMATSISRTNNNSSRNRNNNNNNNNNNSSGERNSGGGNRNSGGNNNNNGMTTRSVAGAAETPDNTPLRDRKAVLAKFNEVRKKLNIGENAALRKKKPKAKKFHLLQPDRIFLENQAHQSKYRMTEKFTDRSAEDLLRGLPEHLFSRRRHETVEQTVVVESRDVYADHRFYVDPVTLAVVSCITGTPVSAALVQRGFKESPHVHAGATDGDFDLDSVLPASFQARARPVAPPAPLLPLVDRPAPTTPSFPKDLDAHWPKLFFQQSDITNKKEKYAAAVVRAVEEKVLDKEHDAVYSPYYMWTNEVLKRHGYIRNTNCPKLSNYLSHYCYIVGTMGDKEPKDIELPSKKLGTMATAAKHDLWGRTPAVEGKEMSWLLCAAHLAKTRTAATAVT